MTNIQLPETTYELTFYDREGEEDSVQTYTDEATGREVMNLFDEPDSEELYSRIALTAYDWSKKESRFIAELNF